MLHPDDAGSSHKSQRNVPPRTRSPHPYRRESLDIPDRLFVTNLAARDRRPFNARPSVPRRISRLESDVSDYFSRERDSRWGLTTSPSDSGTEADDEKPYLRGLPSATGKASKGLIGRSGTATPSDFDDVKRRLLVDARPSTRSSSAQRGADSARAGKHTGEYAWKWRGELLRRILEVSFLCALVQYSLSANGIEARPWPIGDVYEIEEIQWSLEIAARDVLSVRLQYGYYVIWVLWGHLRATWQQDAAAIAAVPSPYDPALFLYPYLIPPIAAFFVYGTTAGASRKVLINSVLAGGSVFPHLMPKWLAEPAEWLLGICGPFGIWRSSSIWATSGDRRAFADFATFLFPLQLALTSTVQHFCATSLLPAETKLLSVGLINLLLFAESPQMIILFSLLWIGGLILFISCRHVMKWSTMLARIPGWKFRAPRHNQATAKTLPSSSGAIVTLLQTSSLLPGAQKHDSSDDKEWVINDFEEPRRKSRSRTPEPPAIRITGQKRTSRASSADAKMSHTSSPQLRRRPSSRPKHKELQSETPAAPKPQNPQPEGRAAPEPQRRVRRIKSRGFLWLSRTQANVVKWIMALFVYLVAVGSIFGPIRWYIQEHALHGREPVGWALGYLFGDIPPFRYQVLSFELSRWIALPRHWFIPDYKKQQQKWTFDFVHQHVVGPGSTRLLIIAWCVANLTTGLVAVFSLRTRVEVDTRRKIFHGMMVTMFLPAIFIDPCFIALALILMLAIFLLLDLFRAAQLPPISKPLTNFLAPYVDGRDHKGPVVISPIFLLIGCAIPLWLSIASQERIDQWADDVNHPWFGWEVPERSLGMVAGVICVGMGDAAASLIGRRFGRRRWIWSGGKSVEGSAAFMLAVVAGLTAAEAWRRLIGWPRVRPWDGAEFDAWDVFLRKAALAGAGASFTEAVLTGGNDNVIVPVILWLLVRVLEI